MLTSSVKSGDCGRYLITTLLPLDNCPESHWSIPAMILSSVDLPVPFTPITPIFSPEFTEKSAPSNSTLSVYALEKFLIVSRFIVIPDNPGYPFVNVYASVAILCNILNV